MATMDNWTIALLVIAAYLAVMALVRLMIRRRDQLLNRFREEMEAERQAQRGSQAEGQRSTRKGTETDPGTT